MKGMEHCSAKAIARDGTMDGVSVCSRRTINSWLTRLIHFSVQHVQLRKRQNCITQQLQSNIQPLNAEVMELRDMVATFQSEGTYWHFVDSQIGSEEHHSKKASQTSKVSRVSWNQCSYGEERKGN